MVYMNFVLVCPFLCKVYNLLASSQQSYKGIKEASNAENVATITFEVSAISTYLVRAINISLLWHLADNGVPWQNSLR